MSNCLLHISTWVAYNQSETCLLQFRLIFPQTLSLLVSTPSFQWLRENSWSRRLFLTYSYTICQQTLWLASTFVQNPSILTLSTSTTMPCPVSHLPCIIISASLSSVQSLSRVQLFATPWTAAHQDSLSFTNSQSLLKLVSIESVMPSSHLILCHPLLLPPSIFPSIRVFSKESVLCITWPKYCSFSLFTGSLFLIVLP